MEVNEEYLLADYARVDFFVPKYKLVIELNGPTHYNCVNILNRKDRIRQAFFVFKGYKVLNIDVCMFLMRKAAGDKIGERWISKQIRHVLFNGLKPEQMPKQVWYELDLYKDEDKEIENEEEREKFERLYFEGEGSNQSRDNSEDDEVVEIEEEEEEDDQ